MASSLFPMLGLTIHANATLRVRAFHPLYYDSDEDSDFFFVELASRSAPVLPLALQSDVAREVPAGAQIQLGRSGQGILYYSLESGLLADCTSVGDSAHVRTTSNALIVTSVITFILDTVLVRQRRRLRPKRLCPRPYPRPPMDSTRDDPLVQRKQPSDCNHRGRLCSRWLRKMTPSSGTRSSLRPATIASVRQERKQQISRPT